MIQATAVQGYTYQNLEKLGFSYVTSDANIMDDEYLKKNGIDKEKVLERQAENKKLTINEAAMTPYLIMAFKAMHTNMQRDNQEIRDRLQIIEEKLDIFNGAMYQTQAKIDQVGEKIEERLDIER